VRHTALAAQWGDIGTWFGGVATAGAFVLTWGLLLITRREQRETRAEKRQSQARLVSAWSDQVKPAAANGLHAVTVKLQNSSDEPIYGVRAAAGVHWSVDEVPYEELDIIYIVPPKTAPEQEVSVLLSHSADGSYELSPPVEIIFYDATRKGLWLRDRFGRLTELTNAQSTSVADHFFKKSASLS
jgi:hypothetical protein